MRQLDAGLVLRSLGEQPATKLDELEIFASITSTNTHLLAQPPPAPGRMRVAIADHQTAGRGRHERRWLSPPGAGLYLSLAYSFDEPPGLLPALTLAIGVGIMDAMRELQIEGVDLKWPNDIVALDGKLGGVLTEAQSGPGDAVTIVTGIGLNIELHEPLEFGAESDWAQRAVDLKSVQSQYPAREIIAGTLIGSLYAAISRFASHGFDAFVDEWRCHDWLHGQTITVDTAGRQFTGVAAGVDADGALLVDVGGVRERILSGSIVMAGTSGTGR